MVFVLTGFRRTRDYVTYIARTFNCRWAQYGEDTGPGDAPHLVAVGSFHAHHKKKHCVSATKFSQSWTRRRIASAQKIGRVAVLSALRIGIARVARRDSLNVNPNFGAVTYRGLAHQESRYRERPESSAREDRLPRALLSVHFARDRRPAEIARTLRDLPTLYSAQRYTVRTYFRS